MVSSNTQNTARVHSAFQSKVAQLLPQNCTVPLDGRVYSLPHSSIVTPHIFQRLRYFRTAPSAFEVSFFDRSSHAERASFSPCVNHSAANSPQIARNNLAPYSGTRIPSADKFKPSREPLVANRA